MKWLLVSLLVFLVASRRWLLGGLVMAVRRLPQSYRDGAKRAADPAAAAKEIDETSLSDRGGAARRS